MSDEKNTGDDLLADLSALMDEELIPLPGAGDAAPASTPDPSSDETILSDVDDIPVIALPSLEDDGMDIVALPGGSVEADTVLTEPAAAESGNLGFDDLFGDEEPAVVEESASFDDLFGDEDVASVDLVAEAPVERSVVTEDPLLDILDGDLDEFLAEPAEESYSVRTSGGDILGPYTASQIENMLSSGMLLGAEEVSTDDENWSILAQHPAFAGQVDQTQLIEAGAMDAPAFPMVDPTEENLPELAEVAAQAAGMGEGGAVIAQVRRKGPDLRVIGVGLSLVGLLVGAAWWMGWISFGTTGAGGEGAITVQVSKFASIDDILKKDSLDATSRRAGLLENETKQNPQDLESKVSLARLYCELALRFGKPMARTKLKRTIAGLSADQIRGNAYDFARSCNAMVENQLPQAAKYISPYLGAKDVEALNLAMLLAAEEKKVDEIQRNLDLALGASGEDYHARLWFTAARSFERAKALEESKEAFVNVTDRDSTRADAWLGQARVAMDLLDEAPDEDQLEPIERALQEAEKAIDALRSKKAWAGQIYRFMGELQVYRSDYAEAARIMEKGLTYLPKDTELIARVAHVLRLGGDFDGAKQTWERLLEVDPGNESGIVGIADIYIQTAKYEAGATRLAALVASQKNPTASMIFWEAELTWFMGNKKTAKSLYQKVLKVDTSYVRAIVALGRIDLEENNIDTATKRLKMAETVDPKNAWVFIGWGDYYKSQKNFEMAEKSYREAVRADPDEPRAHYLLAKALLLQGRRKEALKSIDQSLVIEERNPKFMVERARVLDSMERHSEAINLMKRAIRVMPNEDKFYVQLSDFLIERGNIGEARNHLQTAAGLDRENAEVHFLLGKTYVREDPEKALGYLQTADQLRPKHSRTLLLMGESHYRANRLLDAVDRLSESIGVDSGDSDAREWRARAYRDQGQFREALLDLDQALRIRGDEARLFYQRGEIYRHWAKNRDALKEYKKGIKVDRKYAPAHCRSAEIYVDGGKLKRAWKFAQRCVKLDKTNGPGQLAMAMLYKDRGNYEKARDHLKQSVKVQGDHYERAQDELETLNRFK